VLQQTKKWLEVAPWQAVVTMNQELCQGKELSQIFDPQGYGRAQALWDRSVQRLCTLEDALDLCRQSCALAPFTFNNGNTFAAVARLLVEDWLKTLPPVEAQIVNNTIGHYVVGRIGKKELLQVFQYFAARLPASRLARPSPVPAAAVRAQAQAS
jgi:hypothetical protein